MKYNFSYIEQKWQKYWKVNNTFKVEIDTSKPKYYVLDMFPYPSGAGLHVGHPLGYIASDIYCRYKRSKGFNILHPMGYDAFGLPAEQYAIETGQHPAITTENNINRYREQMDKIGFSYDWSREVRTSDPNYYKWTQWIFLQLFNSWYCKKTDKAQPIPLLIQEFEKNGNHNIIAACTPTNLFSSKEWKVMSNKKQQHLLLNYRLAYLSDTYVNWCPGLGTVLANEEIKDGVSERGGFPVVKKIMKQWLLRTTAYAERLLKDLDLIEWSESIKDIQRNWIGRSEGATINFNIWNSDFKIEVFTTRPDTIYGATYMVLAPEHEMVNNITIIGHKDAVSQYIETVTAKSERDRITEIKNVTGQFTGSYAVNPFTNEKIPIWVAEYVLAGYGTGAIMAVPAHDSRDYAFAKKFNLPIKEVIQGGDVTKEAYDSYDGIMINSELLNGLKAKDAISAINIEIEKKGLGKHKINYRLHDAVFNRQRYWGEPFPIVYNDEIPCPVNESDLPVVLPKVDSYKPTGTGDSPLINAKEWVNLPDGTTRDTNTMPGWAGSSWYFLRYMDPDNKKEFVSKSAEKYWGNVDLYIGGAEHATGHLLYSRFWNKFLFDSGYVSSIEPFQKLINQGMIQGRSNFVYRIKDTNKFVSFNLHNQYDVSAIRINVNLSDNDVLNLNEFKKWRPEFENAEFILEDGKYMCGVEVEKMSKSKYNVVNPDEIINKYGADTLRMYEMFLGPLQDHKPWNTHGIEGVFKFLNKFWRLFFDETNNFHLTDEPPADQELKILYKTIKKVQEDIERFSFNTAVSTFMICVNELTSSKCKKKAVLKDLLVCLSSYAPHICEELWHLLGNKQSISCEAYPKWKEEYLLEDVFEYPISINGKMRSKISLPVDISNKQIEEQVLNQEVVQKWLDGKAVKRFVIVPKRIINIVV